MIDPTLNTIFAFVSLTPGVETAPERVMSLVERIDGEKINVLKSLRDMLKSTVTSLPAAPVRLACAHNGFDLKVIQVEVEGKKKTNRQIQAETI